MLQEHGLHYLSYHQGLPRKNATISQVTSFSLITLIWLGNSIHL
jgi:hypothetical protein